MTEARPGPQVSDLLRDVKYDRRVVIFYDVLGWQNHINRAAKEWDDVNLLRRVVLKMVRAPHLKKDLEIKVSTFSDNVIISQKPSPNTPMLLKQLAVWQLGAAINGFLLRGGVTVGDLIHEDEIVFGPGLNRAYYLESKIARFPRFVLDPDCIKEFGNYGDLCTTEEGVTFINPFRLAFCEHLRTGTYESAEALTKAGLPTPRGLYKNFSNEQILHTIVASLNAQIKAPISDKDFAKVAWLYDRLAKQIGLPLANSYPRIRPKV